MYKNLIIKSLRIILSVSIILGLLFILSYSEHHYTRIGSCRSTQNNFYTFHDTTGNVWEFYSEDKIPSNTLIEVKMFSNCTIDNITDDIIVDYQILETDTTIKPKKDF